MANSQCTPTITRCAFIGNSAQQSGAGMLNGSCDAFTLTDCTFSENSAHRGGGMRNLESSPELINCTFSGNACESDGGGMRNDESSPSLIACTFHGNSAGDDGGGMHNDDSSPTLVDCVLSDNVASDGGGGMYNSIGDTSSGPTLVDCAFSGNAASEGGGLWNNRGTPTLANCMFSGNSAYSDGGGMYINVGAVALANCTFSGNSAGERGGGVYTRPSEPTFSNCTFSGNSASIGGGLFSRYGSTLTNCILWGDSPQEVAAEVAFPVLSYCDVQGGWPGEGNIDADPLFIDADGPDHVPGTEDDNLRLAAGSPCIDAADNLAVPPDWADLDGDGDTTERTPLDLWGLPRFWDDPDTDDTGVADPPDYPAAVDMGAYEYHVPGDLDFDADIDGDDYWLFAAALPSCAGDPQYNPAADLDYDGCVTLVDYQIWLLLYREANPPHPAPVPGPKPGSPGHMDGSGVHGQTGRGGD
jgi:predicted outer membrane repeat protein